MAFAHIRNQTYGMYHLHQRAYETKKIIIWMLALTEGWHSYSVSNWSNYWQWLLVFVRACACICVSAGAQMCAWALSIESSSGWDSSIWSILSSFERIHHWNRVIDFVMIILRWLHFVQLFMFRIMLKNGINYAICAHTAAKHIQREREIDKERKKRPHKENVHTK